MDVLTDLYTWLRGLEPGFAFLLALPFVVAAISLLAIEREARRERHAVRSSARDPGRVRQVPLRAP